MIIAESKRGIGSAGNTCILEGRVDICSIATLFKFFSLKGIVIETKSSLLKNVVETLVDALVENDLCDRIIDVEDAAQIMERISTNRDKKVRLNLGKAIKMQREDEGSKEQMRLAALEYMKVHRPDLYELNTKGRVETEKRYVSGESDIAKLSPEAQVVPDLMAGIATGVAKQEN